MKDIVCYHANCLDGLFSAGIVNKFLDYIGDNQERVFIQLSYDDGIDFNLFDKETTLWIVDFSFPFHIMKELNDRCMKVILIDHHVTSEANLLLHDELQNTDMYIDIKHSGAYITWDTLFMTEPPKAVLLIEDRDLWRFKYPETREFTEGVFCLPNITPDGKVVKDLLVDNSLIQQYVSDGKVLKNSQSLRIARAINRGYYGKIKGHNAFFVNSAEDVSEIGERIYLSHTDPIVAVIFNIEEHGVNVSLRSNTINVEQIAQMFKGGGHIHAAGFKIKTKLREIEKLLR